MLDLPVPKPEPGEVVIQMKSTGICGSDLHPYRHPTPLHLDPGFISGHEPCGVIAEIGAGRHRLGGRRARRAVLPADLRPVRLLPGRPPQRLHQPPRIVRPPGTDGSHTEYMRVEAPCLMRLPEHLSFLDGAILSCQGGTAYAPLTRLGVSGRDVLVVSGLGPVGLLSVIFAKPMGATIVGIDPSAGRRALAEKLGAAVTLDPTAGDVGEQLRAHFPDGADKLTETSGATPAHMVIGDLLKPLGTAAIVGLGNPTFQMPMFRLAMRELTVFGSSIYPNVQFDEMTEFIKRHNVKLESIVSHSFPLEEGPEAYQIAADANSGKVCFSFD